MRKVDKKEERFCWCIDAHKYWLTFFTATLLLFGFANLSESQWSNELLQIIANILPDNVGKRYAESDFHPYIQIIFSFSILLTPFAFFHFDRCTQKRWGEHKEFILKTYTHFQYMIFIWFAPILGLLFLTEILGLWYEAPKPGESHGGVFYSIRLNSKFMITVWAYLLTIGFSHTLANFFNYYSSNIKKEEFRK